MTELRIRSDFDTIDVDKTVLTLADLSEQYGISEKDWVKLNQNENPYGPVPEALTALEQLSLNRYPDTTAARLRQELAGYNGVQPDQIVCGNGGDEIIDVIFRLLIDPGDTIINFPPTFGFYPVAAKLNRATLINVPRTDGFELDLSQVAGSIRSNTKLIIVCSPNNPTGNAASKGDLLRLLEFGIPVLVDEAYMEFANETKLGLQAEHPHLMINRTLSKWAGLATAHWVRNLFTTPGFPRSRRPVGIHRQRRCGSCGRRFRLPSRCPSGTSGANQGQPRVSRAGTAPLRTPATVALAGQLRLLHRIRLSPDARSLRAVASARRHRPVVRESRRSPNNSGDAEGEREAPPGFGPHFRKCFTCYLTVKQHLDMATELETGLLIGLLIGEGHFGGDGRQPHVTLRMHVRHEHLFRWIDRTFPGGRLYGPYAHSDRRYFQWMARGEFLRQQLMPLLDSHLSPELDEHAWDRFSAMKERYARQLSAGSRYSRGPAQPEEQ